MSVIIRQGNEQDIPEVLELVKQLAEFEKAPGEVEVSVKEMENWGFGKNKVFDFFVLLKNNKIVGTAIYYYKYSTWKGRCLFLEDIIVTESERNQGFGKML
ncbi:MAG: GNAT family N-acetyltransferase, partial [Bacteroidia bacterium]|nr:GNAT family N-acetyltransferase [Bacteroidia bacterium]